MTKHFNKYELALIQQLLKPSDIVTGPVWLRYDKRDFLMVVTINRLMRKGLVEVVPSVPAVRLKL